MRRKLLFFLGYIWGIADCKFDLLFPKLSDLMRTIEEHASTHWVFTIDRDFLSDHEDNP
ncbi:MAG: hypothetical protein IIA61_12710 [Candidatus Marinimicrobia bacterium]|nr:hypothetical protein [Candidatus Neomarinimicrobiota bacterium]